MSSIPTPTPAPTPAPIPIKGMPVMVALAQLRQRLETLEVEAAVRVSLARELAFLEAEATKPAKERAHPSDLRWHYLILLSRCRGTAVLTFLLDHVEVFEALEAFALGTSETPSGPPRSFQMKKIDELEMHELFLYLAEKIMKERRESSRALAEVFFDLKTLQGQALETKYRRNRTDIRYAWARVRRFAEGTTLFEELKGARVLRGRLKSFLDL